MEEVISEEPASQKKIKKTSHEPFFGVLVIMIVVVFLVLLASYGGWFLYHGVKNSMTDKNLLSIENIPMATSQAGNRVSQEESKSLENKEVPKESTAVNKKIAIKVLNGGAAKGSASIVADLLKAADYAAVSIGNSAGDYSGVSIYFTAPAIQSDANAVKEVLLKKYPSSTTKAVVAGNSDINTSGIIVIVGK